MDCGAVHPDHPEWICNVNFETEHEDHVFGYGVGAKQWDNESYVSPIIPRMTNESKTRTLLDIAGRATPVRHARTPNPNSIRGYERIQPKRGTREDQVLSTLRAANGAWVPGHLLCSAEVGGSEGLRRLRDLRDRKGWPIESREPLNGEGTDEYRLVENLD